MDFKMLSIIIPTLNEEEYLPLLLESIKKQNFGGDFEIIVSDSGSGDRTIEIAEKKDCKVVSKIANLPAISKNNGANNIRGDLILFADADVVLPQDFLNKAIEEFNQRGLGVASFYLQARNKIHNLVFGIFYNLPSRITEKILPQAMNAILIKTDIHRKIGGFNGKIRLGEELDYIRRGKKFGKFGILKSAKIFTSPRRFQQDGWVKTWLKYLFCQLYMIFLGPVTNDIFRYKFNHYSKNEKNNQNFK